MKIAFIGISNKLVLKPFELSTKSGQVIDRICNNLVGHEIIKCNLVELVNDSLGK